MSRRVARSWFILLAAQLLALAPARAEVKLHGLFSDHAVLQRGIKLPIWGTTDKPDDVTVSLAGQTAKATPAGGKWRVDLQPLVAGGPHVLAVSQGDAKLERQNVLVGDVWLCGGQSNMQWSFDHLRAEDFIAQAKHDQIRLFEVPRRGAPQPETDTPGPWRAVSPETIRHFSAVGYFFGQDVQAMQKVPIGLINSNIGGTTAERWASKESIEGNPTLKDMSKPQGAFDLYNAMIAPLAPYGIRGAIWYQGESNADRAVQYRTLLPVMVKCWRDTFGQGDFPFLIVQLAPFMDPSPEPQDSAWAELRDAQLFTAQSVPNVGLAVITDLGDAKNIHPPQKQPVGHRLALAAAAIAYGEKIVSSGPVYEKMTASGKEIRIHFKHVGGGLVAKDGELTGFAIAGADKKFVNAQARIDGETVVVSSDKIADPVAVRFGWANYPVVNLFNKEGLPAAPFRTDDFPSITRDNK